MPSGSFIKRAVRLEASQESYNLGSDPVIKGHIA